METQITVILAEEIDALSLSKMYQQELRKHVEVLLNTLIDKVDKKIWEGNTGSAEGWVKQAFLNIFVSLKDVKKAFLNMRMPSCRK